MERARRLPASRNDRAGRLKVEDPIQELVSWILRSVSPTRSSTISRSRSRSESREFFSPLDQEDAVGREQVVEPERLQLALGIDPVKVNVVERGAGRRHIRGPEVKVGLVTSSAEAAWKPSAMPLTRVVLPAPKSPRNRTTSGGDHWAASARPKATVSSAERVRVWRVILRKHRRKHQYNQGTIRVGSVGYEAACLKPDSAGDAAFIAASGTTEHRSLDSCLVASLLRPSLGMTN